MREQTHPLVSNSPGVSRTLHSWSFGPPGGRPKVYIQASLHAGEIPGMLVAQHLRQRLQEADRAGLLRGEVVLVPVANPIGLGQRLDHQSLGRFEFGSSENFNRHYPNLSQAVAPQVLPALGVDPSVNVNTVRAAVAAYLAGWMPRNELDSLRRTLLGLAHDADVVLDLHCDCEAVLHLYTEESCWPALEPLARRLGCETVLLAKDSGGGPFDECLSGLWWQLAERAQQAGMQVPLPQGCASTTVELRGEADVQDDWAAQDAQAIWAYLGDLGVVQGLDASPAPALPCSPTPLAGSETLHAPRPGILVFKATLGQHLAAGDLVAELVDPLSGIRHPVCTQVDGVFYARVKDRFLHTGEEIGKVAGARPFRTGPLLGF